MICFRNCRWKNLQCRDGQILSVCPKPELEPDSNITDFNYTAFQLVATTTCITGVGPPHSSNRRVKAMGTCSAGSTWMSLTD
jgi:hypothetical protein